jgi:hypothetical protein
MSTSSRSEQGVVLPQGHTGSSFFHHVLQQAVAAYPAALGSARLPVDAKTFKRDYRDALVRFEAARVAAQERVEIARLIANRTQDELAYAGERGTIALAEHMAEEVAPPALHTLENRPSAPGLVPVVPFEGKRYVRREILGLCERMVEHKQMTHAALAAARFIIELIEERGGSLDLRGERFALLGAGAELAPTPLLLRAGARVLWVDVAEPSARLTRDDEAGELIVSEARDLLRAPNQVAAALARFASEGPIHVGMFAYAAGASREWRLGAAMNAIVRKLDPSQVRSLSFFVSPTMPASVQPEDAAASIDKLAAAPGWQAIARGLGLLPTPGHLKNDGACIARGIVSIQGLSYQAAQYVSKVAAAETFAVYGIAPSHNGHRSPVIVSANVAGITNTRSLAHPLFQAAFIGAPRFGVRIFEPATTRALSGLLILSDLLNPSAPGQPSTLADRPRDKASALLSQQVHGGIYSLPYELESAIRVAAVAGMAQRPSVLWSAPRAAAQEDSPTA